MTPGLLIASALAIFRLIRVRRSGITRTAIAAFICLLIGTACEVVLISIDLYGAGDPAMIAGLVGRVVVDTALTAVPFTGMAVAAQLLRRKIGL